MLVYIGGTAGGRQRLFPAEPEGPDLNRYLVSMLETVQMAFLAHPLSVLIAFPLRFSPPATRWRS
jgi:ABC-type phosphate/phosphonate transport system permease subunit